MSQSHIKWGETKSIFPQIWTNTRMSMVNALIKYGTENSTRAIRVQRHKGHQNLEEVKLSMLVDDVMLYIEKRKHSTEGCWNWQPNFAKLQVQKTSSLFRS